VAQPQVPLNSHLGFGNKEWGFACFSGLKISNGDGREEYATASKRGDIIQVDVDLTKHTIEYIRNGESLGVAFKNLVPPLCPAASLLKGQGVNLIFDREHIIVK